MPYQPNLGHVPDECLIRDEDGNVTGFRAVHVRLFGSPERNLKGFDSKAAGLPPWPAGGARTPTIWKISRKPHPFEIKEWEIA